jgi:hypothetical protein
LGARGFPSVGEGGTINRYLETENYPKKEERSELSQFICQEMKEVPNTFGYLTLNSCLTSLIVMPLGTETRAFTVNPELGTVSSCSIQS